MGPIGAQMYISKIWGTFEEWGTLGHKYTFVKVGHMVKWGMSGYKYTLVEVGPIDCIKITFQTAFHWRGKKKLFSFKLFPSIVSSFNLGIGRQNVLIFFTSS